MHPDVDGGSADKFQELLWAYKEVTTSDTSYNNAHRSERSDDGFVASWEDRWQDQSGLGAYHSFDEIEKFTDDDGWGRREPLRNFFVWRHDAAIEGGVGEGDVAIYRLSNCIDGKSWGVGQVLAMQISYSMHGPNGVVHLQPLMKMQAAGTVASTCLVEDPWAEVVTVRALDRFELLEVESLPDTSFTLASRSHARVFLSGMVYVPMYDDFLGES